LLRTLNPENVAVDIAQAGEAELDEMWSFVRHKGNPRWLWHRSITTREKSWPMSLGGGRIQCFCS